MEDALIRSDVELSTLLDHFPVAISRLDRSLRYLYANRAAARIFGVVQDSMIGRTRAEIGTLPDDIYRPWDQQCRSVLLSGKRAIHGFQCMTRDGPRHYSVRIEPEFDRDGAVAAILSIANDVTAHKRTEEALQRSEQQRRQAEIALRQSDEERARLLEREQILRRQAEAVTSDAQAASRMKDEFLANLSHELRTPLNAILGWTQTLQSGDTTKETLLRALAQIEQSAREQAKLIDDLLNVSDIVAGHLRLDVRPMCLVPSINAAIETLYPAINAKSLHLETTFELDADVISGDLGRVRQIMWNLLSNAVKFTPQHGKIRIALCRDASHAAIVVTDTGKGIAPDFLPYVFDRFHQADSSTRKPHGGLGAGLAIARHLAEMHGGTIEVYSAGEGCGSTFTLRLPIATRWKDAANAGEVAHRETSRTATASRRHSLAGLRILSVDDDSNTRDMLQEALAQAGAEVWAAASARDAFDKLQDFRPDVLVSDIGMPNEDGCDLLQQIRLLPAQRGGTTPAIALTGYARDDDREAARRAGYQAVVTKPVSLDELLSTILSVAARRRCIEQKFSGDPDRAPSH
jgi:PAS domain S-box-containing protein